MPNKPPRTGQPRPSGGKRYPQTHRNQPLANHCQWPTGCHYPDTATPTNPLTREHTIPRSRGGKHNQPPLTLCRRHNSTKGNQ